MIESVPGRLSGAWVLTGTRLPLAGLFENLESGATVKEYLEWFDGAEEWKVRAVLQYVADSMKAAMPAGTLVGCAFQDLEDDREDSTAPHIAFRPQLSSTDSGV